MGDVTIKGCFAIKTHGDVVVNIIYLWMYCKRVSVCIVKLKDWKGKKETPMIRNGAILRYITVVEEGRGQI
jgi:hypothetical protein